MAQAIGLNPIKQAPTPAQEKPCYAELLERIQAIWNAVCAWICDLANRLLSWTTQPNLNLALRNPNCYCHMVGYLEPEDVARCERVAKSWKIDRVWQAQCANYGITVAPPSGVFKDLFKVPEIAFGPREWREHFGKIGPMPPLSEKVRSQITKLGKTHTLTLIPATVNGQPFSLNTFAPLAEKSGMKLVISEYVSTKYGNETAGKSLWVWMQKEVEPGSRSKTQARSEKDYPQKLGKALWIVVSTVAHYARYKICLFPKTAEWTYTYTRARDGEEDKYGAVIVGGSTPDALSVFEIGYASGAVGVAFCHSD